MKPIQLNKHQIEALDNGATMLWTEIPKCLLSSGKCATQRIIELCIKLNKKVELQEVINEDCLFQIGQEYYVQEELGENGTKYFYNKKHQESKIRPYPLKQLNIKWNSASLMQEHQSRIKFKVTDIQVKRVQELQYIHLKNLYNEDTFDFKDSFYNTNEMINARVVCGIEAIHNEQYPDQPYKDNPYGFLVTIERID